MRSPFRIAALLLALATALTLATSTSSADAPKRKIALILDYSVAKTCTVYPNYPKDGVVGNRTGWTITAGRDTVAWRYNINSTWSMISDKKYRNTKHPWWGITRRSCIGTSLGGEHFPKRTSSYPKGVHVPKRVLQGRSGVTKSHYRSVDFRPSAAHVVHSRVRVKSMGTLRDARGRFVIGNVLPGWHVRTTAGHDGPWTKVYVPNAKRWGWVYDIHL